MHSAFESVTAPVSALASAPLTVSESALVPVTSSPAIALDVRQTPNEVLIERAARSKATVLITGPSGVGKTTLARKIHERSARSKQPFVVVNLASIHDGTLESELFGHERGAYTGAVGKRVGRLELAQNGTVFLDEIAELPLRLQARLLEFIQHRTITPLGSNRTLTLDVRIVAATNRDLAAEVRAGKFREDLFHRLRVFTFELPRLKQLPNFEECFGELTHTMIEDLCREHEKPIHRLSPAFANALEEYPWPGNFRELRNVLEYAVIAASSTELEESDLPPWFRAEKQPKMAENVQNALSGASASGAGQIQIRVSNDFETTMREFEKAYLEYALREAGGRAYRASLAFNIPKTTLLRRIKSLGLSVSNQEVKAA